jgi:hypothetical protein
MKKITFNKDGTTTKTETYAPHWTMDDLVYNTDLKAEAKAINRVTVEGTDLPGSDCERGIQPLPFFWWLNPWKHLELVFDAYKDTTEVCNAWRKAYHLQSAEAERQRTAVYDLQNELEATRSERDAANDAVRHLRKKRKR